MFVAIDPDKTLILGQQMRTAGDTCEELAGDVEQALQLAELTSTAPGRLTIEGIDLDRVGLVLTTRAELAAGFEVDLDAVADLLEIDRDTFRSAVTDLQDPDRDADGNPLLDLVASDRALFGVLPTSIRDTTSGLPEQGTDAEADDAIATFDALILPRIQNGESIEPEDLSDRERAALTKVTALLGGDVATIQVTERRKFRGGRGDDEYRTVTEDVPITETEPGVMLDFVTARLAPRGIQVAAIGGDVGSGGTGNGGGGDQGGEFDFNRFDGQGDPRTGSIEGDLNQVFGTDPSKTEVDFAYEGNGTYSVSVVDPTTGGSGTLYNGTYTVTGDGYSYDVDIIDPSGRKGSATTTVDKDGFDTTQDLPGGGSFEKTGFPDGSTVETTRRPDGSAVTTITSPDGRLKSSFFELPDDQRIADDDPDRFTKRGDDADQNGFPDFGDARDTVDPNDPTDTGGNGLL